MKLFKLLFVICFALTNGLEAQNLNLEFSPQVVQPLENAQNSLTNLKNEAKAKNLIWDDEGSEERSDCFEDFDRPLDNSGVRVFDNFHEVIDNLPAGAQHVWVYENFIVQEGGDEVSFSFDKPNEPLYLGLRHLDANGEIDCQELFLARTPGVAAYGANDFSIDYDASRGKTYVNLSKFIGRTISLMINEKIFIRDFFVSDENVVFLGEQFFDLLSLGSYRVQVMASGWISQQHYFVKCSAELGTGPQVAISHSCDVSATGSISISDINNDEEFYQVLAINSDNEIIKRNVFTFDNETLTFDNLSAGDWRIQIQRIIGPAFDEFELTIETDATLCPCAGNVVIDTFEVEVVVDTVYYAELDFCSNSAEQRQQMKDDLLYLVDSLSISTAVTEQLVTEFKVTMGPNPTNGSVSVYMSDDDLSDFVELYVTDQLGGEVLRTSNVDFDLSDLPNGIYNVSCVFDLVNGAKVIQTADRVIKLQ